MVVLYGSSSGVSTARKTVITQNSTGIPGAAEYGDRFGSSLAAGDLNADGYADLVVGSQYESIGDRDGVGSATVIWGGKSGLSGGSSLPAPSSQLAEWGGYGSASRPVTSTATARRTSPSPARATPACTRAPSPVRGRPRARPPSEVGSTYDVIAGDLNGDKAAERVYPYSVSSDQGGVIGYLGYDPAGWETHPESDYAQTMLPKADGSLGSVGDINGDGYGDLVLGDYEDPRSDKPGGHKGGQISVWYGGRTAPTRRSSRPSSTRTRPVCPARERRRTASARR
ncbi:VCBS repeat-containing protein OS=Streptomyces alboniger OX=132473 GN=CP975_16960 PE=4 SV=1 [Streptomyces alboniger]